MIEGYLQNDVAVHLLSINTLKHHKKEAEILNNKPDNLTFEWVEGNTNLSVMGIFQNLFSKEAYHVSRFYLDEFAVKLTSVIKEQSFDIIQIEGLAMAVYLPLIRANTKAKVSFRAHNAEFQIWERTAAQEKNPFARIYLKIQLKRLKAFEQQALENADILVAITKEDEQILNRNDLDIPSITIACGISIDQYQIKESAHTQYDIGFLASLDWIPNLQGLDWFVNRVWPIIKRERPNTTLAIAGRRMPLRIKSLDSKGTNVLGEVESMQDFIQSSKINIIPLLAGSGMRIKIIENMALARPMVSTKIGAEGIEITNGKEILIADKIEEFAFAVIRLLDDEALQKMLGRKARNKAEKIYGNKNLGAKLVSFYKSLE